MSNHNKTSHKEKPPKVPITVYLIGPNTYLAVISKEEQEEKLIFLKSSTQVNPGWVTFSIFTVEEVETELILSDLEGYLYLPSPELNDIAEIELLRCTLQKFADSKKPWDEIPSVEVNGALYSDSLPRLTKT